METKRLGGLFDGETKHQAGSVWDKEFVSPTIDTMQGGYREPMIIDDTQGFEDEPRLYKDCSPCLRSERSGLKTIVAMRGRNPDNPSDRTVGNPTEQRLEPNSQGICNTLTSVQKDNLVLENVYDFYNDKMRDDGICGTITANGTHCGTFGVVEKAVINPLKGISGYGWHFEQNVYDPNGLSRALRSESGSGNIPKVIEDGKICVGGLQEHQTPRIDGISPSLTAAMGMGGGQTPLINQQYRIRKLTPLECWRLMDFTDEDFHKAEQVNSNSQLYKQAGNSIVKNVLVAIFGQMILGKEDVYKKLETR